MTKVKVILECPGNFRRTEETFPDGTTIAAVKRQICSRGYIRGARFQDLQILSRGVTLADSYTLGDILPSNSNQWFGRKRLNLTVLFNNILDQVPASTPQDSIPAMVPSSPQYAIESESSVDDVPARILEIFQRPSQDVVDELFHSMSGEVDRDTVCSLYSSSLGETTSSEDAAKQFYATLCEYGLDHHWYEQDTTEGLNGTATNIHTGMMHVLPIEDEASIMEYRLRDRVGLNHFWNAQDPSEFLDALEAENSHMGASNDLPSQGETSVMELTPSGSTISVSQEESDLRSPKNFTCIVCYEELPINDKFVSFCPGSHELCYDCATNYLEEKANSGVAEIQCFTRGCKHEMTPIEIALALGRGNEESGRRHPLFSQIDHLKLSFAIAKDPGEYCTCPREGCNWTVARSEKDAVEKVTCGNTECRCTFCANCLDTYHYRTTCIEYNQVKRAWQSWVVSGRSEYWRLDNNMLQKARRTAAAEKKRIEAVTKAEALDEQFKAKNCRYCPHCGRVVERLSGCNIMRCGYDVDTKRNVQNGCQKKFYWTEAPPYQPIKAGQQVKAVATKDEEKPLHEGWRCDQCGGEIRGLRFECVNCDSYYICERCENSADNAGHGPGHFFRIHSGP